ncbi:MAG: acyltransferase [Clostridia bacterium]|jgi:peptidoglycan/LPS O-acetylase OafA/YrhL|nr:acyltransferase [Clostridia bacterium]
MEKKRAYFLDHLKVFLTFLVTIHHVGQAYGPTGGFWQYKSSLNESTAWLGSFFSVNAAFFMGLFFMISGYLLPASYDRKGFRHFIKDKLYRLGIPTLLAAFVIVPCEMYFYYSFYTGNMPMSLMNYYIHIYLGIGGKPTGFVESVGWPEFNFGHAWFIEQLLIYSILYAIARKLFAQIKLQAKQMRISILFLFIIGGVVSVSSLIIRTFYPIDKWVGILGFIQAEPAHLPQYVTFFIVGIVAFKKDLFMQCDKKLGYCVFAAGVFMGAVIYLRDLLPGFVIQNVYGNWAWYESFMAIFISWGLIVFFREKLNNTSAFAKVLADNSFTAYILHYPIVLAVQYSLDLVNLGSATAKFFTVSILALIMTYGISYLMREIINVTKRKSYVHEQ